MEQQVEPTHNPSPDGRPQRPTQPLRPRPVMSDFGPRPMARPAPAQPVPRQQFGAPQPPQPQPVPTQPTPTLDLRGTPPAHQPLPVDTTPGFAAPVSSTLAPPVPAETAPARPTGATPPTPKDKKEKEPSENGHAGLVGFAAFVVLGALLLSPLIPGKTFDNFPGNSQSFATGSSLPCLNTPTDIVTTKQFTTKLGAPVVYKYATTSQQHATCDGKTITADAGTSGQFNPLGLAMDILLALVVALGIGALWGVVHRRKHAKARRP